MNLDFLIPTLDAKISYLLQTLQDTMKKEYVILGSIFSVLLFAAYNAYQRQKSPRIYIRKKLSSGYNARTIPPFGIYIDESEQNNQELINHELVHWKQYQKKGLLNYYFRYFNELNEYGYDKMPMEQEARANESKYCKNNYTKCVRSGEANTIYKPDFRQG